MTNQTIDVQTGLNMLRLCGKRAQYHQLLAEYVAGMFRGIELTEDETVWTRQASRVAVAKFLTQ